MASDGRKQSSSAEGKSGGGGSSKVSSFFKRRKGEQTQFYASVGEGLKKVYKDKLLPLEEAYDFHDFISPQLNDPDFEAKPMILLVGQYSTGKTSFIRYLLERDYPGLRIGPEPTTDCFNAVMYGDHEQVHDLKEKSESEKIIDF